MIKIDNERRAQIKYACRRWRLDNRYRLQDVADLAGVSRQAVLEFERGIGMSRDMLQAYIDLGMPIDLIAAAAGLDIIDKIAEV